MIKLRANAVLFVCCLCFTSVAVAQRCPPIVESFLSSSSVTRSKGGLNLSFAYSKTGGQPKTSYQAYLVAFPLKNAATISKLTPQQAIADKHVLIIETKIIKRAKNSKYESKFDIETEAFVEKLIAAEKIKMNRVSDLGGWKSFDDQIQLALFIPFLDDEKYSVLDGLPDDSHECNYRGDSALLFEPLGPNLQVCFGVVQAVRLKDGRHYIQMNGKRPAGSDAR
jgi:hypothetical protein